MRDSERMKMEVVEGLRACIKANAMSKYTDEAYEPSSDLEEILRSKLKRAQKTRP